MFNLFKKKSDTPPPKGISRGILPTYVTDKSVILSKAAPKIRNTYEVRVALYMAKTRNLNFILAVRPGTTIENSIRKLLAEHGGAIEETNLDDYCVSFGWGLEEGEKSGWVLGDAAAFNEFQSSIQSARLKDLLHVGASLSGEQLSAIWSDLVKERIAITNVDKENVQEALLALVSDAMKNDGTLFIQ